jgi:flavin reductase (DIM6/NTAB) family NADH-FMN oxidoreductase RutF
MTDRHSYEPRLGHGLPHDPFNAIIAPRPIGWVSTKGRDGSVNLAPYSFFNAFNYVPPIIGFSSTTAKDSLRNCQETGEFVWNLTTRALAEAMNQSCAPLPYGVDEFEFAGLTKLASTLIDVPRVAESPVHFECKVTEIINLKRQDGSFTPAFMVLGEVVAVHIDKTLLIDGIFNTFGAEIVMRAGGPTAYAAVGPESRFDLNRPRV